MARVRFIAALLSRLRSVFSISRSSKSSGPRIELGRRGEKLAARYLRAHGYKVLYRNFRAPKGGEVDIVCREKKSATLAFVEVKTRSSTEFGTPAYGVTADQQHRISRGALAWLRMLDNPDIIFRFDIVEVLVEKSGVTISLIRDAFQLSDPYIY
jgi:putative endonuclease